MLVYASLCVVCGGGAASDRLAVIFGRERPRKHSFYGVLDIFDRAQTSWANPRSTSEEGLYIEALIPLLLLFSFFFSLFIPT